MTELRTIHRTGPAALTWVSVPTADGRVRMEMRWHVGDKPAHHVGDRRARRVGAAA